ncbi:hypothetical protein DFJ58DRAFT_762576 [Suillus subalutaceus]|uniref:uncharacterized protein n=1 Tax=Suillus subalutaceus TaxID=48586 RepID=UPI001B866DC7|nr:uncharacterized protein DFJ58DRAFT_762576 [Suillus subalutaceus]KAG1871849.1 hypothetical protein DFJ58DRAFT_762576 [Suillus subalutaceus]
MHYSAALFVTSPTGHASWIWPPSHVPHTCRNTAWFFHASCACCHSFTLLGHQRLYYMTCSIPGATPNIMNVRPDSTEQLTGA